MHLAPCSRADHLTPSQVREELLRLALGRDARAMIGVGVDGSSASMAARHLERLAHIARCAALACPTCDPPSSYQPSPVRQP